MSKYALSAASGVSQQMIGYVERELRNPTLEVLLRMAEGMNVDLAAIITQAKKGRTESVKTMKSQKPTAD